MISTIPKIVSNTLNPEWKGEQINCKLDLLKDKMVFEVYDKNLCTPDTLLGSVEIDDWTNIFPKTTGSHAVPSCLLRKLHPEQQNSQLYISITEQSK